MEVEKLFVPFEDQQNFINEVFKLKYRIMMFAGSIRAGKTWTCLAILIVLCKIYPKSRWYVIRRDLPSLKRTTIPTFSKIVPTSFVKSFNQSEYIVTFKNGSQIGFLEENYARDKDLNRLKGLEANGFFLNQAEELQEMTFNILISRSGQWKLPKMPPNLILLDSNPTQNWVKKVFYDRFRAKKLPEHIYYKVADIFKVP